MVGVARGMRSIASVPRAGEELTFARRLSWHPMIVATFDAGGSLQIDGIRKRADFVADPLGRRPVRDDDAGRLCVSPLWRNPAIRPRDLTPRFDRDPAWE
jgi:hypothetical protein